MFLDEAVSAARRDARERMATRSVAELESIIAGRAAAPSLSQALRRDGVGINAIAEIKRRSPSAGSIREGAGAAELACVYAGAGASAVSILTCSYRFGGSLDDLREAVCARPPLPLLRKDFITEPYQVLEARAFGASAVLLIAAALSPATLKELVSLAGDLGLDALVEAHGEADLSSALESGSKLVGINNRDLATLTVDLATTGRLLPYVPDGFVVVSESGISWRSQVEWLEGLGVDAILVGEALMKAADPGVKLRELLGGSPGTGHDSFREVNESCG
ncbi:MAG TPA: indole-3-glycerol phosphate synthase TrpC [Candidatus Anoxymicrobiaceae bacterium]|jgi:indole-3-glycerol phosphate synthase